MKTEKVDPNKKGAPAATAAPAQTAKQGTEMAAKLEAAGKLAETAQVQRREKTIKGAHLLQALVDGAKAAGLKMEEKSGFIKITGANKGHTVYVAKKGGRVDLSGFSVPSPAVTSISEEDARQKHLGKVRGMLNFERPDAEVLSAYQDALAELAKVPPPPPPKPAKKAKDKPAEAPAEAAPATTTPAT